MAAFVIQACVGLLLVISGGIFRKYPPKEMNRWYGYRTGNAYKSKEVWEFAQKYSAGLILKTGVVLTFISPVYLLWNYSGIIDVILSTSVSILFTLLPIYFTEKAIKKNFPSEFGINQKRSQTENS